MNLDPDVQRYLVDQFLVRMDMVSGAFTALLIAAFTRIIYRPVIDFINQIGLPTAFIIKAWRNN